MITIRLGRAGRADRDRLRPKTEPAAAVTPVFRNVRRFAAVVRRS
jgi:hypothetical protein